MPILTDDILDLILKEEERLSCSESPITPLNRPPNAGMNPNQPTNLNSSNNQSNGGYRKKESVKRAQLDYNKRLSLNLFEGKNTSSLNDFKLNLPIDNQGDERTTRIVDLFLHHRTQ